MTFYCADAIFTISSYSRRGVRLVFWGHMRRALLVYPFYWLLHSVACARALYQLATNPHYWDKTRHGVSRL
jgi:hypothetical protein